METILLIIIVFLGLLGLPWAAGAFDCPERRGHHYGPVSDLCLNKGCNEKRGSWKWCESNESVKTNSTDVIE